MTTSMFPVEPPPPPPKRRFPVIRTTVLIVAAFLLVLPTLWWRLTPPQHVGVVVVDKTVPHLDWREHERVHWWLEHRRIAGPRGDVSWNIPGDYVGYDPVTKRGTDLTAADLDSARLVYIADAYGVYTGDYREGNDSGAVAGLEPSKLIYGGMTDAEVETLERFVARGGHVVAEFNTLEDPTAGTAAGDRLGRLLGVRFDRWLGRWYGNLAGADEIPRWMRERYERVYWKPWNFSGPGLVVFSDVSDRIVVIDSSEFTSKWPVTLDLTDLRDPLTRHVHTGQPYWYWFSGVTPLDSARTLAQITLHVSATAQARMKAMGFPVTTPAVVRHPGPGLRAYFAGDFADVGTAPPPLRRTRGLDWFGRLQSRRIKPGMQSRFFWRVSIPLWDGMLSEARHSPP